MSHVAGDFQSQASNAALAKKAGRQSLGQPKAASGRFDDLLAAIPDAPPPARAKANAPERPQPAQSRAAKRDERPGPGERPSKPDNKAATRADNSRATPTSDAPAADEAAPQAGPAASESKSAGASAAEATPGDDAGQTAETPIADTSSVTPDVIAALIPQAPAVDPAPAAGVADTAVDGDKALKTGAAKPEHATAATPPSMNAAEQQAAALTEPSAGLSADDAEVLSALAAKAQQGLKDAQSDKTEKKADTPARAAKPEGQAAIAGPADQQAQTGDGDAKGSDAKPVQSDLAKLGVEHQRTKSDAEIKPADHAAQGLTVNSLAPKTDGMPLQNFSAMLHQTHAAGTAAAAHGPASASSDDKAVSIANVPVEITAKISAGKNQFDIRLDPEELGRIHVKVNVDRDGNITTHMMADRPETLDLLRRDTQGLERALQDAGLKTSDNGMQFSLRDQAQQQQQNQQDGQAARRLIADEDLTATVTTTVIARDYGRYLQRPSGVDIRV